MDTHRDADHEAKLREMFPQSERSDGELRRAFAALKAEADEMRSKHESVITGGADDEEPIRMWERYGVHVRELPERETDAELNLSRVSIGGVPGGMAYLVFRGPAKEVKMLLRRAANALRDAP